MKYMNIFQVLGDVDVTVQTLMARYSFVTLDFFSQKYKEVTSRDLQVVLVFFICIVNSFSIENNFQKLYSIKLLS